MLSTVTRSSLWRHSDFLKMWAGQTVSEFGSQFSVLAIPLAAILLLNASTLQVGLLTTFEFLPFLLVGLPAGVVVDRVRRRGVLITCDAARAVILAWVPLSYAFGLLRIWELYGVVFASGVLTVFFDVAYQSYLAPLVGRQHLIDGNAKLEVTRSAAQVGGPGIAGALLQVVRAPVAVAIDAASFAVSALAFMLVRTAEPAPEPREHRSMRGEITEGLRYVLGHRWLRPIAACTATSNLFGNITGAIILVYAVRELGLSPATIGLVFAIGNAGWMAGALISAPAARLLGVGRCIWLFPMVTSTGWLLIPLAPRHGAWAFLLTAQFVTGMGGVVYNINQVSLRQAITPDRLQGRMNATIRFLVWGTMPIGALLGGVLGSTLGLRPTLWIAAVCGLFPFLPVLLSPVRQVVSISAAQLEVAAEQTARTAAGSVPV